MSRRQVEAELVRRMLRGDERAFFEFFDDMFPRLYRFALSRLGEEALAEEIVQATLVKAIDKLDGFRGEAALFTWLCTFCRHEMSAVLRRAGRRRETALVEDTPEIRAALDSLLAGGLDDPERNLERSEVARLVRVTLDHLPAHYGQALSWKYLQELPVKEIAERLGLGLKAAESVLTRARLAFRDAFTTLMAEHALGPGGER